MLPRPRPIPLVRRSARSLVALALASVAFGCAGPNRWGYARDYVPTPPEKSAEEGARPLDATMAELKPEEWRGKKVHLFLVIDERKDASAGAAYLTGKMHVRNEVNGCANKHDEDTCRVTIKPGEGATVHVQTTLVAEDREGELRVGKGTLLHVVGALREKVDPDDGKLVVDVSFYRQWPIGYYAREGEFIQ
jgi:hypothetical protein